MRDTTVRQRRVPHSFDTLSEDCNVPVSSLLETISNASVDENLSRGLMMFNCFLEGQSYEAIAIIFNVTRHTVNRDVHRAYKWVRQTCCPAR